MAIMGDNVFGNDPVSSYFRQRLGQIQGVADPGQQAEELRRLQRDSDYMASYNLPPQLSNSIQNQIIANPYAHQSYSQAAEQALYDLGTALPGAPQDRLGALAQQIYSGYLSQPPHQVQAVPAGTQMLQRAHGMTGGSAEIPGMSGVGQGEVNGRFAAYPIAGQVPQYRSTMEGLGWNPSQVNTFDSEAAFNKAREDAMAHQNDLLRQKNLTDPRVLAQGIGNEGKLKVAQIGADAKIEAKKMEEKWRKYISDNRLEGVKGQNEVKKYGIDKRSSDWAARNENDLHRTQLQQSGALTRTQIRAGLDPNSFAPGKQHAGVNPYDALAGQMGGAETAMRGAGDMLLSMLNNPQGQGQGQSVNDPGRGIKPLADQVMQQIPGFARNKYVDRVQNEPGFEESFLRAPEWKQVAYLKHLVSGR